MTSLERAEFLRRLEEWERGKENVELIVVKMNRGDSDRDAECNHCKGIKRIGRLLVITAILGIVGYSFVWNGIVSPMVTKVNSTLHAAQTAGK